MTIAPALNPGIPEPAPMKQQLGRTENTFGSVAKAYQYRYGYCRSVLETLHGALDGRTRELCVVDLGAGTGVLTRLLSALGCRGHAVEPDPAMRAEALADPETQARFLWSAGTAEQSGLADGCADWICMGDAFHWADHERALPEIHRLLRPGGRFTAVWALRDLANDALQKRVDSAIRDLAPSLRRVYEDVEALLPQLERILPDGRRFADCIQITGWHCEATPPERYLRMLDISHDIKSQVSQRTWQDFVGSVEKMVRGETELLLRYVTRSWTVKAV